MSLSSQSPVQPTRDQRATLAGLVDVLLNKGVYLDLDLIITVADIPLIGVNLRATIAGMETMLEYGLMKGWDERTRAWVRQSVSRQIPLLDEENVLAKMPGGYYDPGSERGFATWRLGTLLLTTHRLIVFRREPPEILWESTRSDLADITAISEPSVGQGERTRIEVRSADGEKVLLLAAQPGQLVTILGGSIDAAARSNGQPRRAARELEHEDAVPESQLFTGDLWYRETRAGPPVWRGGTGTYDSVDGFTWKAALDRRPAVRLKPGEITNVYTQDEPNPAKGSWILVLESSGELFRLAGDRVGQWAVVLYEANRAAHETDERGTTSEVHSDLERE